MVVSAKVEYACLAALALAEVYGGHEPLKLRDVAQRRRIPPQFLAQIFQQLRAAGLIRSQRGVAGGYRLSRDPAEVTVWDIIMAVEGRQALGPPPADAFSRAVHTTWREVEAARRQMLESVTLADWLTQAQVGAEAMYYI